MSLIKQALYEAQEQQQWESYQDWITAPENQEVFRRLPDWEQWKPVVGYPGYEVSSWGNVRSFRNNRWGLKDTPSSVKQRKPWGEKGYRTVGLGRGKKHLIHRLVAEAFIPNPDNHPNVLHGDSIRYNNNVGNLRWGTQSENIRQGVEEGSVKPEVARRVRHPHLIVL